MKASKNILSLAVLSLLFFSVKAKSVCDNYGRLYVGFSTLSVDNSNSDNDNGFHLGYVYGANVTGHKKPVFLQLGIEYNLVTQAESDVRETFSNVEIPLNLTYKFKVSDYCSFEPLVGISWRFNASAKISNDSKKLDYLSDLDAHPFQFGVNVGAWLCFDKCSFGYRFNPDLTNFLDKKSVGKDLKTRYHFISIGLNF